MSDQVQGTATIPATVSVADGTAEAGPPGDPLRGLSQTTKMVATIGVTGVLCVIVVLLIFNLMQSQSKPGELAERLIDKMTTANKETVHEFKEALKEREVITRDWVKSQGDRNAQENDKTRAVLERNAEKTHSLLTELIKAHDKK